MILMDIGLPNENGIDLAKQLHEKSEYSSIPVIFLTAHSDRSEVIRGIKEARGVDYC